MGAIRPSAVPTGRPAARRPRGDLAIVGGCDPMEGQPPPAEALAEQAGNGLGQCLAPTPSWQQRQAMGQLRPADRGGARVPPALLGDPHPYGALGLRLGRLGKDVGVAHEYRPPIPAWVFALGPAIVAVPFGVAPKSGGLRPGSRRGSSAPPIGANRPSAKLAWSVVSAAGSASVASRIARASASMGMERALCAAEPAAVLSARVQGRER